MKECENVICNELLVSGHWGPALALIGLSYAPAGDTVLAVVMLTVAVGINAGQYTGYLVSDSLTLCRKEPQWRQNILK